MNADKHTSLYDDAKHRQMRQEHIYSKCIDRECTFKPALITKKSKLSQNTIKEVQEVVRGNLAGQNNAEFLSVDISAIQNNSILRNNLDLSINSQNLPKNKSRMQYLNKSGFRDNEQSVYKRLQHQANIYHSIRKEIKAKVEDEQNIDPVTG